VAEERALLDELVQAEAAKDGSRGDLHRLRCGGCSRAISQLFDAVLIMDEDAAVRENRLALLQRVAGLASGVVDLQCWRGFRVTQDLTGGRSAGSMPVEG
jgi:glycyl-tRNA synthetase